MVKTKVAQKWNNVDSNVINPIRNTKQDYLKFINTSYFSEDAMNFLKHGRYTDAPPGTPDYEEFWDERENRCFNGYEVGGVRITGRHYFFLNFGMMKARPFNYKTGAIGNRKIITFPRFLDHQYYHFHELEDCFDEGPYADDPNHGKQGMIWAKARRKGSTFEIASGVYAYNYNFLEASNNILGAYEKEHYSTTLKGIHYTVNHLNKNTVWAKRQQGKSGWDHFRASYKYKDENNIEIEDGYMSEVRALSYNVNAFKGIGATSDVFGFEEAGRFVNLMDAYTFAEPMWREGSEFIGVPLIWGCLCAGSKVYDKNGAIRNIEELTIEDGIVGYDGQGSSKEPISWLKPPEKKPCYRIDLSNGNYIECSYDHPFMWSRNRNVKKISGTYRKITTIKRASQVKEGDQLFMIDEVPIFGDKRVDYARELGLMLGDGSYTEGNTPEICASYDEVYHYMLDKYNLRWIEKFTQKNGRKYWRASFRQIKPMLEKHGMVYDGKIKTLPSNIHEFDEHSLCEFIAGYFDADGNISYSKSKGTRIALTSIHRDQLEQVKYLLLKLGIDSSIYKEYPRRHGGCIKGTQDHVFRLYVSRWDNVVKFREKIIPLSEEKKYKLNQQEVPNRNYKRNGKQYYFQVNPDNNKWAKRDGQLMSGMHEVYVKKVEYIGLKKVYNLTASKNNSYLGNAVVTLNTGGDMDAGSVPFSIMFYAPEKFGLKAYENIYDTNSEGECGYFIDNMWFYPGQIKKTVTVPGGKRIEKEMDLVDNHGNSYRDLAEEKLDQKRKSKEGGDRKTYNNFLSQEPKTPKEAFMRSSDSPLPVKELGDHEVNLRINPKRWVGPEHIGDLSYSADKGKYEFKPDPFAIPITKYPLQSDDPKEGAIVIWEHPQATASGDIPYGVYIAGIDPYSDDGSETSSLGSIWIMNRLTNRFVAEYTGKPKSITTFYEKSRKLLLYYNAIALYEANKKGIFSHFEKKNCLYLLAETPRYLRDKGLIGYRSVGNDSKGLKIQNREVIIHGITLFKEWLEQEIENEEMKLWNLHTIKSHPLLQEAILWNPDDHFKKRRNYDRMAVMVQLFILKEALAAMHIEPEEEEAAPGDYLHHFFKNQPLFKQNILEKYNKFKIQN